MKTLSFILTALCSMVFVIGCSSNDEEKLSPEDYDRANSALRKALTAWKEGQPSNKWQDAKAPIRFVDDDWKKKYRLVDFNISKIHANADGHGQGIVRLTLKLGDKPPVKREALYNINVKNQNQVIISRDPMY